MDLNRVFAQAAGRRFSQKPEFKYILGNVEFPLEQNSVGVCF